MGVHGDNGDSVSSRCGARACVCVGGSDFGDGGGAGDCACTFNNSTRDFKKKSRVRTTGNRCDVGGARWGRCAGSIGTIWCSLQRIYKWELDFHEAPREQLCSQPQRQLQLGAGLEVGALPPKLMEGQHIGGGRREAKREHQRGRRGGRRSDGIDIIDVGGREKEKKEEEKREVP